MSSKTAAEQAVSDKVRGTITEIQDFPKAGIFFRDITTLLSNGEIFAELIAHLADKYRDADIDAIAGTESRGFIFAAPLAVLLKKPFVPIRKKNKLPREVVSVNYTLEYGTDSLELHKDAVPPGSKVLVVDDLIATGGTIAASIQLFEMINAKCVAGCFILSLPDLGGIERLKALGMDDIYTIVDYPGL